MKAKPKKPADVGEREEQLPEGRVDMKFMIAPDQLRNRAYVRDRIRCVITNPESPFIAGLLGDSGLLSLARAGAEFYFTRRLAKRLISRREVTEVPGWGVGTVDRIHQVTNEGLEFGESIQFTATRSRTGWDSTISVVNRNLTYSRVVAEAHQVPSFEEIERELVSDFKKREADEERRKELLKIPEVLEAFELFSGDDWARLKKVEADDRDE